MLWTAAETGRKPCPSWVEQEELEYWELETQGVKQEEQTVPVNQRTLLGYCNQPFTFCSTQSGLQRGLRLSMDHSISVHS